MTKQAWQAHMAAEGLETVARPGNAEALKASLAHMTGCPSCRERRATRRATRAARDRREAMRSLGLVQVRGGGWE